MKYFNLIFVVFKTCLMDCKFVKEHFDCDDQSWFLLCYLPLVSVITFGKLSEYSN